MNTTGKDTSESQEEVLVIDDTSLSEALTDESVSESASFDELKEFVSTPSGTHERTENIDDERQAVSAQGIRERETQRIGEEEYYKLRNKWSWFIFGFVAFMLAFQLCLTISIGFSWMDFSKYPIFLHLVIGQNFAQIIGMGFIVAKFLFPNLRSKDGNRTSSS